MHHRVLEGFTRGAAKLAVNTVVLSLREGYVALIPFFVLAALLSLVSHWLGYGEASSFLHFFTSLNAIVWGLFPVVTLLSFTYYLAKNLKLNTIAVPILVLICFCTATQYLLFFDDGSVRVNYGGGLIFTIAMPIFCCYLIHRLLDIRKFKLGPASSISLFLNKHLNLILPYIIVLVACLAVFPLIEATLNSLSNAFNSWVVNKSDGAQLALNVIGTHIMWFLGVHGDTAQHTTGLWEQRDISDSSVYLNSFVMVGGVGGMWGLVLACFIHGRASYESSIAKLGAPLVVFNLSEVMVYALPIVFNPYFLVPFLTVPLTNALLSEMVFSTGVLSINTNATNVPWFMPVLFNGYLSTGSLGGALWQVVLICVNALMYLPFVRANSRHNISGRELDVLIKRVSAGRQLERQVEAQFARRDNEKIAQQKQLNRAIKELKHGMLCLYYQPKVCNKSHKLIGYEALLRVKKQDGSIIAPWFIDILDKFEMMDVVDSFVIDQLELDLLEFKRHSFYPKVSFNISPQNLINRRYKRVIRAFSKFPEQVEVEILESTYIDDFIRTQEVVAALKENGIRCAIDDFGTGYSCLSILSKLNVDTIKFDRSLLPEDEHDKAIHLYKSLSQMCHQLGFEVIAEGVESEFHIDYMRDLPVDQLQGYYFSKPLNIEQAIRECATRRRMDTKAARR
ncbi:EAL domain-containing protein [Pseudoalteromonas pernae]|uniref:EAL domain-containing protein n=1 Tax=Pseudoalteromonas pernae TaxID=3118054 RepID=UPI003242816F